MRLRAFADDLYDFRPAAWKEQRTKISRSWRTGVRKISRTLAGYDWEDSPLEMQKSLDAFCTGVILLAILYFTPILISLF